MVNSEELIGTTEYVTLYKRCRLNRSRYNRFRLYFPFACTTLFSISKIIGTVTALKYP
jgi:hypothetical protein